MRSESPVHAALYLDRPARSAHRLSFLELSCRTWLRARQSEPEVNAFVVRFCGQLLPFFSLTPADHAEIRWLSKADRHLSRDTAIPSRHVSPFPAESQYPKPPPLVPAHRTRECSCPSSRKHVKERS